MTTVGARRGSSGLTDVSADVSVEVDKSLLASVLGFFWQTFRLISAAFAESAAVGTLHVPLHCTRSRHATPRICICDTTAAIVFAFFFSLSKFVHMLFRMS